METRYDTTGLLDLMARPAFLAAEGRVIRVNDQAAAFGIAPGAALADLLFTGAEEYAAFETGCLYLTLSVDGQRLGAAVTRMDGFDVFCLEELADSRELQAMALAAKDLRRSLNTVMVTAQWLFPVAQLQATPETREQVAQLNRGLYQILRVLGNMSDAGHAAASPAQLETVDIVSALAEIFSNAAARVEHTRSRLRYEGHPAPIYCLADRDSLERAVLNMISNAIKFSPPDTVIQAALTRRGNRLYLTMENQGDPIPANIRGDLFTRYLRQGGVGDSRFGIGLGMVLIRAAAAAHGGTVLIDQPAGDRTRVTMSLAIREGGSTLRSNVLHVDYAGEMDRSLIELSDSLPAALYENEM